MLPPVFRASAMNFGGRPRRGLPAAIVSSILMTWPIWVSSLRSSTIAFSMGLSVIGFVSGRKTCSEGPDGDQLCGPRPQQLAATPEFFRGPGCVPKTVSSRVIGSAQTTLYVPGRGGASLCVPTRLVPQETEVLLGSPGAVPARSSVPRTAYRRARSVGGGEE